MQRALASLLDVMPDDTDRGDITTILQGINNEE
jgi:hypothetical protein